MARVGHLLALSDGDGDREGRPGLPPQCGSRSAGARERMRIRDYLTPDRIDLRLDAPAKAPAIERLVMLVARSLGLADPAPILDEVLRREEILSTGVGDGIAIPHAAIDGFADPVIALGVSK